MSTMRELLLVAVLALASSVQALAQAATASGAAAPELSAPAPAAQAEAGVQAFAGATAVRAVSFAGGGLSPSLDVAAAPGVRFGLELVPAGPARGAPLVLEAVLTRPGDEGEASATRWFVAARAGEPVQCVFEFAYAWEAAPGAWTMTVFRDEKELARAAFTVSRAPALSQEQGQNEAAKPKANGPKPPNAGVAPAPAQNAKRSGSPEASLPAPPRISPAQPKSTPPPAEKAQPRSRLVGGAPGRTVHALIAGSYSTEAKALWMAAFFKQRGVAACVRLEKRGGRSLWQVVAGWKDTREAALAAKRELAPVAGDDVLVRAMAASELEKGLECR